MTFWPALPAWWLAPLSGAAEHSLSAAAAWHGRLMVLSWSLIVPLAILIARFFKVTPGQNWPQRLDNKLWWRCHYYMQQTALAVSLLALGVILLGGPLIARSPLTAAHHLAGWGLLALGAAQFVGGKLRGDKGGPTEAKLAGDHFDMTPRRLAFERIHKTLGWLALPLALAATLLGLALADAPRWMALVLTVWWALLILAFVVFQRRGMCIDTYQAIWGPDPALPGNRIAPVGWGVRRPQASGNSASAT